MSWFWDIWSWLAWTPRTIIIGIAITIIFSVGLKIFRYFFPDEKKDRTQLRKNKTPSTRQPWIDAAKILIENPDSKVSCPECKDGILRVEDTEFGNDKIDRYLICDFCNHYNVITMSKNRS